MWAAVPSVWNADEGMRRADKPCQQGESIALVGLNCRWCLFPFSSVGVRARVCIVCCGGAKLLEISGVSRKSDSVRPGRGAYRKAGRQRVSRWAAAAALETQTETENLRGCGRPWLVLHDFYCDGRQRRKVDRRKARVAQQ